MLEYFYHFRYDDEPRVTDATGKESLVNPLTLNMKVYSIAEKYSIAPLKVMAKEKFAKQSSRPECWLALKKCLQLAYGTGGEAHKAFRTTILQVVYNHKNAFFKQKDYLWFRNVAMSYPKFLLDYAALGTGTFGRPVAIEGGDDVGDEFRLKNEIEGHHVLRCPICNLEFTTPNKACEDTKLSCPNPYCTDEGFREFPLRGWADFGVRMDH
jgi:hypothetical protein